MCDRGNHQTVRLCKPRPASKRQTIEVDYCLVPLVQKLNEYGVETTGCCCGHREATGWITFMRDGEQLEIKLPQLKGKIYLTESMRYVDGEWKAWCGIDVMANSKEEAQKIADAKGIELLGELTDSFDAGMPIGEIIKRMRRDGMPEEMTQDMIDAKRKHIDE